MARARLLKPGFFTNERIVELDPFARLLFAGLWTVADREGRLEDRPKRLKLQLFPADDIDIDALLNDLVGAGLIERYRVGEGCYIAILGFKQHQSPHMREPASTIPAPGQHSASPAVAVAVAVADPDPESEAVADPVDGLPAEPPQQQDAGLDCIRAWEQATGTTVTRQLADYFDSQLAEGFSLAWMLDAIAETGAAGAKNLRYLRAIVDRWKLEGRGARASPEDGDSFEARKARYAGNPVLLAIEQRRNELQRQGLSFREAHERAAQEVHENGIRRVG